MKGSKTLTQGFFNRMKRTKTATRWLRLKNGAKSEAPATKDTALNVSVFALTPRHQISFVESVGVMYFFLFIRKHLA